MQFPLALCVITFTLKQTFSSGTVMHLLVKLILLTGTLVITSCATLTSDIEIETHTNPDINILSYKTYAWADNAQIVFDPIGQWEQPTVDTDEDVRSFINRELRARNLKQVDNAPDLLVTFSAGIDSATLELKEDPNNDIDNEDLTRIPKEAMVVALIDAKTGYTVWTGYASGGAQEQQTIKNIRGRINFAVHEIFKSL